MRILFVYPNIDKQTWLPVGLSYIISIAKREGHTCELFDVTFIEDTQIKQFFIEKLRAFRPNLIAYSCRSLEWTVVQQLTMLARQNSESIQLLGGPHPTLFPEVCVRDVDIVVRGEGEVAFSELLFHISHNKDYRHIKNIYSKFNNKVFKNEVRPLIANLDELPYPNWDMWDDRHISNVREYFDFESKKLVKKRTGQFETSRGCPYSCSYCINNALKRIYKNKGIYHRTKSVHRIINELIFYVNRYKLEHINLIDDTFLMDLDWLREFAKEYRMKVNLPFAFYTRPELVNKETMRCVVEAGANMIRIGIECGDEDYRKNILLRNYTNNQIINAFKTAKMFGINTYSFNIIGLPSIDTALLIKKTININRIVKPDHIQVTTFFPFPGTDIFKYSLRKKYFKYQNIFSKKSFYDETVLKLPRISARHLFRLSKLFNAYVATDYLSFRYIYYKTLENSDLLYRTFIERTNGLYNFLKPVIFIMKKFIKFIEKNVRRKTIH